MLLPLGAERPPWHCARRRHAATPHARQMQPGQKCRTVPVTPIPLCTACILWKPCSPTSTPTPLIIHTLASGARVPPISARVR